MTVEVVHMGRGHSLRSLICIDRTGPWGNPFKIGRDGTREDVLRDHENWLRTVEHPLMQEIWRLEGRPLGCWCEPLPCHGWLLAYLANCKPEQQLAWELGEPFWTPFMLKYRSMPGLPGWRVKLDDL